MPTLTTRSDVLEPKDPDNTARLGVDYTDLLPDSVTLASAQVVAISPAGLSAGGALPVTATVSGARASALFSGGTVDVDYRVTFRATYSDGQTRDVSITIPVRER